MRPWVVVFTVPRAKVRGTKNIMRVFDFQGRGDGSGSSLSSHRPYRDVGSTAYGCFTETKLFIVMSLVQTGFLEGKPGAALH